MTSFFAIGADRLDCRDGGCGVFIRGDRCVHARLYDPACGVGFDLHGNSRILVAIASSGCRLDFLQVMDLGL